MADTPVQQLQQPSVPQLPRRALLLSAALLGAAGLTRAFRPETLVAASGPGVNLETLVPAQFGDWSIDTSVAPIQPSPDVVESIKKIYDATLARSYISTRGERVMLSIAYGGDQSGRLRVHRPEACYSAQGFHVKVLREEVPSFAGRHVEVKRLLARLGPRNEPITYWIRVGKSTVSGNLGQRLIQLQYGINGEIPDGLIFRVSTIERDPEAAFKLHDRFVAALFSALDSQAVTVLAGA